MGEPALFDCTEDLEPMLGRWLDSHEGGALVFVPEAHKEWAAKIAESFQRAERPLAGAIFPEVIWDGAFRSDGVLLVPLGSSSEVRAMRSTDALDEWTDAVAGAAEELSGATLLLLFDAMIPNLATVLATVHRAVGDRATCFGANAGSETFQPMPCLFDADGVFEGGGLGVLLPTAARGALLHGYRKNQDAQTATATTGNCVETIAWRPAREAYADLMRDGFGVELTAENFYEHAVNYPFGIPLGSGEVLVRIPVAISDDGGLFCVGEIAENALLTVLDGTANTEQVPEELAQRVAGEGTQTLFYCAGRRMQRGVDGATAEIGRFGDALGTAAVGALSLGEIGSVEPNGYPHFHNAALVALSWDAV